MASPEPWQGQECTSELVSKGRLLAAATGLQCSFLAHLRGWQRVTTAVSEFGCSSGQAGMKVPRQQSELCFQLTLSTSQQKGQQKPGWAQGVVLLLMHQDHLFASLPALLSLLHLPARAHCWPRHLGYTTGPSSSLSAWGCWFGVGSGCASPRQSAPSAGCSVLGCYGNTESFAFSQSSPYPHILLLKPQVTGLAQII